MSPSRVPSSQIGRLLHYGALAAGIGFGAVSESLRRATASSSESPVSSPIFSAANMEQLVRKLSRMRGAALKLGQMISIQGINFIYTFLGILFMGFC
jgi:aarF domain-containing kinase